MFVLQITGTKRWVISEPVLEHPLPGQTWDRRKAAVAARAVEPPLLDCVLEPGDALYLPRGFLHAATAQGALSIHLTVGVHPVTGHRLAQLLADSLETDPELRRSLPVGVDLTDPSIVAEQLRVVAESVLLAAKDSSDVARRVAARLRNELGSAMRPSPLSPLAQLAFTRELTAESALVIRPGLRYRLTDDDTSIEALDRTVTVPPNLGRAVRMLLDGGVHTPADLPGLDVDEQLVISRRLLREGLIVAAPADGGAGG